MEKEHKFFLIVGVPIWIVVGLFFIYEWFVAFLLDTIFLLGFYFAFLHGKKHHRSIHLIKIGFIMMVMQASSFIMLYEDPMVWGNQYVRNVDISRLITPEDENVQILKTNFEIWLGTEPSINGSNWAKYSTYYDDGLIKNFQYDYNYCQFENISWIEMDEVEKCMIIDWYVREYIVNWTSDTEVYGVREFKATPHEILNQMVENNWTAPAQDDCDGQAVVTVSLMKSFGINAYIGDGRSHWFTVVSLSNETLDEYPFLDNVIILNFWQTVRLWCYFNESEFHVGQSPLSTILDVLYIDNIDDAFGEYFDYMENWGWSLIPLSFIIALIAVLFIGYPRKYENESEISNRFLRKEKLTHKIPWSQNMKNPLNWIFYFTYVRTGNPFRKIYKNEWFNTIIFGILILLPAEILFNFQSLISQYALIYLNLYIFLLLLLLDRDFFVQLKENFKKFLQKNQSIKIEQMEKN